MGQEFYVLKDEGKYYPMAFITVADEAGEIRKDSYKLREGEEMARVRLVEVQ